MQTSTYTIIGMTCQNCVKHVREALTTVPGVTDAQVELASGLAKVTHDAVDEAALIAAVEEEGYQIRRTA